MNGQELLEELRVNILRDVSDAVDAPDSGALWDDPTLVRYINDGLDKFAVETCLLRDETTPQLTQITLQAGVESYALDPRVIAVLGARIGTAHLVSSTYGAIFSNRGDNTDGYVRVGPCGNGRPSRFYTDRESRKIGVYPPPGELLDGQTMILRVARKQLAPLRANDLTVVPEIPEEYHLDVLEWAAWRALRNHDTDAEDMAKASAHKKRFEDAIKELSRKAKRMLTSNMQFDIHTNWGC